MYSARWRKQLLLELPKRRRFLVFLGTCMPSRVQSRCTRLRLTFHPSLQRRAQIIRYPNRGCLRANSSMSLTSCTSSSARRLGLRWVALCCPAKRQARRSESSSLSTPCFTARLRLSGLRSFPLRCPLGNGLQEPGLRPAA